MRTCTFVCDVGDSCRKCSSSIQTRLVIYVCTYYMWEVRQVCTYMRWSVLTCAPIACELFDICAPMSHELCSCVHPFYVSSSMFVNPYEIVCVHLYACTDMKSMCGSDFLPGSTYWKMLCTCVLELCVFLCDVTHSHLRHISSYD